MNFKIQISVVITLVIVLISIYVYRKDKIEETSFEKLQMEVDTYIIEYQDRDFGSYPEISESCKYTLQKGKRLRPVIFLAILHSLREPIENYKEIALAIEYIHTSSIIIDDIQDEDDMRRNQQSIHKKVGRDHAILVSSALAMAALKNTTNQAAHMSYMNKANSYQKINTLINHAIDSLGIHGAVSGQYADSNYTLSNPSTTEVEDIHIKKTSSFFEIAFIAGWILGNGDMSKLEKVKKAGTLLGLAYQISDDYEDLEKDVNKQEQTNFQSKNYTIFFGENQTKEKTLEYIQECQQLLEELKIHNNVFSDITNLILNRFVDE